VHMTDASAMPTPCATLLASRRRLPGAGCRVSAGTLPPRPRTTPGGRLLDPRRRRMANDDMRLINRRRLIRPCMSFRSQALRWMRPWRKVGVIHRSPASMRATKTARNVTMNVRASFCLQPLHYNDCGD
jgi:hypothetical protein